MNRSVASSNALRFDIDGILVPVDDDELGEAISGLECLHHRDDRGGLGPVALPAPDSQGEPVAVDQQASDDLRGRSSRSLE